MASNKATWVGNLNGAAEPLVLLGIFEAGATHEVKRGEILNLVTTWHSGTDTAVSGIVAIANEEIKSGDRAGYYEIIVPRPGDVFEFELATAAATAVGTAMYLSTSQKLAASGSNILAYAVGQEHYPQKQGHLSDAPGGDAGTTVRTTTHVRVCFKAAASYYAILQVP